MDFSYPLSGLVTLLSLAVYMWMAVRIGKARAEHNVPVPRSDGPDGFLRVMRVHGNTMEGLILFLPALWLFALTIGDPWAALVGIVYPIARVIYARGYYAAADKRGHGFTLGLAATAVLIIGSFISLTITALRLYI